MSTETYQDKLAVGIAYEQYIGRAFREVWGLVLHPCETFAQQITIGENKEGIEIKKDRRFRETKNLYIEMAEKTNPANPVYVKSGVFRHDNTWLFCIGDELEAWLFLRDTLSHERKTGSHRFVETPTSRGFLMAREAADKLCHVVEAKLRWHFDLDLVP